MSGVRENIAGNSKQKEENPTSLRKNVSYCSVTNDPKTQWHTRVSSHFTYICGVHLIKSMPC